MSRGTGRIRRLSAGTGALWAGLALLACAGAPEPRGAASVEPAAPVAAAPVVAAAAPVAVSAAVLPGAGGRFAPALTELSAPITGAQLADTDRCTSCHEDVAAQWQTSAHAIASFNNPIYRTSVQRFRAARGPAASRFCAGCHDPALLVDGAMDAPEIAAADPRAHAGVTCQTCHGIDHATHDGNGSYRLGAALAVPDVDDPASVAAHRVAARPAALGSAAMCGSCHKAFLGPAIGQPHHLPGADDLGPWLHSAYAGSHTRVDDPVAAQTCAQCHMPREAATRGDMAADADGMVASHRFPGGHTWLAAMRGDEQQVAQTRQFMAGTIGVDIAAVRDAHGAVHLPADGAPLTPGEAVELEVVVRNLGVGHHFPGGTRDAQDAWVEVAVYAADGRLLADSPEPHRLGAAMADAAGVPLRMREIEALHLGIYDHTLAPRDARVVRFTLPVPEALAAGDLPLRAVARVQHRSRTEELRAVTCSDARKREGRAFLAATLKLRGERLDACAAQPVTELARAEVQLGAGAAVPGDREALARRAYVHGLGLLHEVQEHLGRAERSFAAALAGTQEPGLQAQALAGLAAVAGRQGRADAARELTARAAALAAGHPAPAWVEGQALAAVWRWAQATGPLAQVAAAAPDDPAVWSELALAHGSAGAPAAALQAAQAGLRLAPRSADLLRIQALALAELGAGQADAAMAAYLEHRSPDNAPRVRSACSRGVPGCARERVPVHAHPLRWR